MKFYVTEHDRKRARALSKEIEGAQSALWELIAEARNSGAHASLGFRTWGAYAEQTLDTKRLRMSAVNAALDGREAPRLARTDSPQNTAIIDFIREHPGCTSPEITRALRTQAVSNRVTMLRNKGIIKYQGKIGRAMRLWLNESDAA